MLAALSLAVVSAAPAFCDTVSFAGNSNQTLGTSAVYGPITAYGFTFAGVATDLYSKFGGVGSSETGLGIAGTLDNEITPTTVVQLSGLGDPFTLTMGSTQSVEGFDVYGSNTLGTRGAELYSYITPGIDPFTTGSLSSNGYSFISITADPRSGGSQNVVLDSLTTTTTTPEPSSLLLLGTGILAAAGVVRRKLTA